MKIGDKVLVGLQGLEELCIGEDGEGNYNFEITGIQNPEAEDAPKTVLEDGRKMRGYRLSDIGTTTWSRESDFMKYLHEESPGHWVMY